MEQASYKIIKTATVPEAYKGFIISTYLNSNRFGNDWFKKIDRDAYYEVYTLLIEKMMKRPEAITRIAVLTDEPDVAIGWSITRPNIVDYVFVKKDLRMVGIGKSLVPEPFQVITHITKLSELIRPTKFKETTFNPFV